MRLVNGVLVMIVPIALGALFVQLIFDPAMNVANSTTIKAIILGVAVALLIYLLNRIIASFRLMSMMMIGIGFVSILVVAMTSSPPHFEFSFMLFLPLVATLLLPLPEILIICVLAFVCLLIFGGSLPTMPREAFKDLVIFIALAQAFIIFVAQQRNQMERDRQQLTLAKTHNDLLGELLNNLSHDFRTPLTIINTSAYLLWRSSNPKIRQEHLDLINQHTMRLSRILDHILTISRLDYTVTSSLEILDLNRVLHMTAERFQAIAHGKHLKVTVEISQDGPLVLGSQEYLRQALDHILENAVQFTPPGGTVTIRSLTDSGQAVVEITDTGIGIDEDDLPLIFDPFFRGDSTRSTDTGGVGLGLCIAKRVVEMHAGSIEVESALDRGTIVRIALPVSTKLRPEILA
ncbi:MAG: HAMP domain-containing histidine kinase [Anaerolineae bacterium]|nr:HAMP domain-containing histidine kinase [Anaerolineae bacterium]